MPHQLTVCLLVVAILRRLGKGTDVRDRSVVDGMVQFTIAVGHETRCSNVWVCAGGCVHSMRIVWCDCVALKGESVYAYTV